ncbi:hypothetical protein EON63_20010 [archaeon]|nr:MAG: hypothetical protein EON63_20010 [archaeon]
MAFYRYTSDSQGMDLDQTVICKNIVSGAGWLVYGVWCLADIVFACSYSKIAIYFIYMYRSLGIPPQLPC